MAKLTVTVAVFLFVLALAQARIPLDHKENDVITEDLSTNEQESDPKNTDTWPRSILLSQTESETETEAKPETFESEKPETETNDFVPLTVINFHPINRHFRHPSLTFRHRRPCHHHRLAKPWGPSRLQHREMTYGNDMLVSKGDGEKEVREIPTKWSKFPHGDALVHRLHDFRRDDDVGRREGFMRPYHHHLHHFHRSHVAEGEKERSGQQNGFMTKIRKFLIHF